MAIDKLHLIRAMGRVTRLSETIGEGFDKNPPADDQLGTAIVVLAGLIAGLADTIGNILTEDE